MRRPAFTLIELLAIVAIMGTMVTVGLLSVGAGQRSARLRGATRDIFALIRHARSTALVTQQPAIITYSTVEEDGEMMAKVEITSAKVLDSTTNVGELQTITGEPIGGGRRRAPSPSGETAVEAGQDGESSSGGGETIEDILFAPISSDIVRGVCVKVTMGDEELDVSEDSAKSRPKISVFSNVDYLLGKFKSAKDKEAEEKAKEEGDVSGQQESSTKEELQEPVSVVWEVNGRVDPHQVWIYQSGTPPDKGLSIKIDRFGAAKVVGDGGDE